jgi:hypothetical protein
MNVEEPASSSSTAEPVSVTVDLSGLGPLAPDPALAATPNQPPQQQQQQQRTPAQKKLVTVAAAHGVRLLLMPPGMARRQANTSSVSGGKTAALVNWRVQFDFPGASLGGPSPAAGSAVVGRAAPPSSNHQRRSSSVVVERGCQDKSWLDLIAPKLSGASAVVKHELRRYCEVIVERHAMGAASNGGAASKGGDGGGGDGDGDEGDAELLEGRGCEGFHFLLRKEPGPANAPLFYDLPPRQALKDSLSGKTIIEFPTVLIVLAEELAQYSLAQPLIEEVEKTGTGGLSGEGAGIRILN